MTVRQAAVRLKVSRSTVYRRIKKGIIEAEKVNRRWVITMPEEEPAPNTVPIKEVMYSFEVKWLSGNVGSDRSGNRYLFADGQVLPEEGMLSDHCYLAHKSTGKYHLVFLPEFDVKIWGNYEQEPSRMVRVNGVHLGWSRWSFVPISEWQGVEPQFEGDDSSLVIQQRVEISEDNQFIKDIAKSIGLLL